MGDNLDDILEIETLDQLLESDYISFKALHNLERITPKDDLPNIYSRILAHMAKQKSDIEGNMITYVANALDRRINQLKENSKDGLTGLNIRKEFDRKSEETYQEHEHEPYSIIMMDLDNFKPINDHYGHPAGDKVLKSVGSIIHDSVRDRDISGRYGGEEFIILLPKTGLKSAYQTAERLRKKISYHYFGGIIVSASFGVSSTEQYDDKPILNDLIDAADQAMYQSKNTGRNQVTKFKI